MECVMEPKHYLQWSQPHLNGIFAGLRQQERFCDITIACDSGELLKAHRAVLCACSEYFDRALDVSSRDIMVILKDCPYEHVKLLLEFMYNGQIDVQECEIASLRKTAETLQMTGLLEAFNAFERGRSQRTRSFGRKRSGTPLADVTAGPKITKNASMDNHRSGQPAMAEQMDNDDLRLLNTLKYTFDESNQSNLFATLARIESKIESLSSGLVSAATEKPATLPKMQPKRLEPIKTLAEMDELEEKLKDKVYWNQVLEGMKGICGSNSKMEGYDACYALVDRFFSREFLAMCSWTGRSRSEGETNKIEFRSYKETIGLFYELARLADPAFGELEVEKFFMGVLKNSRRRLLQRQKNLPRRKSTKRKRWRGQLRPEYAQPEFVGNDSNYTMDEWSEDEGLDEEDMVLEEPVDSKAGLLALANEYAGDEASGFDDGEQTDGTAAGSSVWP